MEGTLSPYERWMVTSNLATARSTPGASAAGQAALLRANGYGRVADAVERAGVEEAVAALHAGKRVRVTVGGQSDAVLVAWIDDGRVMSEAVEGWCAGVVEPVCFVGSDYLAGSFLAGRELAIEGEETG